MKKQIFLFAITTTFLSGFFVSAVYGYGVETHAFLTKEVISFYNKNFPQNKINSGLVDYLIDGSRQEDNAPRFLNHFYDPVNNRGLNDKVYRGQIAKDWAEDEKAQTALVYKLFPDTESSILTASQLDKLKPIVSKSDFTWQKAIALYARGETEQAMFVLGHIIHLIEDMSVPDHTRNDSHPPYDDGGSPFENWTAKFDLKNPDGELVGRLTNEKPILLGDLNNYFDDMANYSNNNFYSKDSIKNYELPKPENFSELGDFLIALSKDGDGNEINLYKKQKIQTLITKSDIIFDDPEIMKGYWSRLSVKSVQYSAGVINLFFHEAEKAKEKLALEKAQRPYLATLVDGFQEVFGGGGSNSSTAGGDTVSDDEFELVAEIPIPEIPKTELKPELKKSIEYFEEPILQSQKASENLTASVSDTVNLALEIITSCSYNSGSSPSRQGVILNEVAWMGSFANASDEWLELKNISGADVDISGWQVIDKGEQIKLVIADKLKLPPGGFYLSERTDDNSVPGALADQFYVGALSNTDEGLRLFDKNCGLIDEVVANTDWPAGENSTKRSMERSTDLYWHTYIGNGESGVLGTPKKENSQSSQNVVNGSLGYSAPSASSVPVETITPLSGPSGEPGSLPAGSEAPKILISEVQVAGVDAGDEFIELYNPTGSEIDLSGWSIQYLSGSASSTDSASKKNFETGNKIAAQGFFLIARGKSNNADGYAGAKTPDLTHRTFSMSGSSSGAKIFIANNQEKISGFDDENIVDKLDYSFSAPLASQSLERKAKENDNCVSAQNAGEYLGNGCDTDNDAGDFQLRPSPNPQNSSSLFEPRSAPAAAQNFRVSYNSSNLELTFNWDVDPALSYKLVDTSSSASVTLATSATTSFSKKIAEIGRDYIFDIIASDAAGMKSATTTTSISVPSFLSTVSFYQDTTVTTTTKYLFDINWDNYPFVPIKLNHLVSGQPVANNWHAIIFYYNSEATSSKDIMWLNSSVGSWGLNMPGGFKIKYLNCKGSNFYTTGMSLILPETSAQCSALTDNQAAYSINWNQLGGSNLSLEVHSNNFTSAAPVVNQDYVTMAFYAYQPGYEPNNYGIRLIALDKNKYYFSETEPQF